LQVLEANRLQGVYLAKSMRRNTDLARYV
jgi:hypothetical protein